MSPFTLVLGQESSQFKVAKYKYASALEYQSKTFSNKLKCNKRKI